MVAVYKIVPVYNPELIEVSAQTPYQTEVVTAGSAANELLATISGTGVLPYGAAAKVLEIG